MALQLEDLTDGLERRCQCLPSRSPFPTPSRRRARQQMLAPSTFQELGSCERVAVREPRRREGAPTTPRAASFSAGNAGELFPKAPCPAPFSVPTSAGRRCSRGRAQARSAGGRAALARAFPSAERGRVVKSVDASSTTTRRRAAEAVWEPTPGCVPGVAAAWGCQALPAPRRPQPAPRTPRRLLSHLRGAEHARPPGQARSRGSGEPGASAGARQVRKRTHGRAHTHGAMSLRSCLPAAHSAGFFPLLANQLLKEELPRPGQRCAPRPAQLRCGGGKWAWNSRRLTEEHSTRLHSLSTDIWNSHCGRKQNQTKAPKLLPPSEALTASAARGHSSPRGRAQRRPGCAASAGGAPGAGRRGRPPAAPPRRARTPGAPPAGTGRPRVRHGLPTRPARPGNRFILLCLFSEHTAETGRARGQAERRQLPSEREHS